MSSLRATAPRVGYGTGRPDCAGARCQVPMPQTSTAAVCAGPALDLKDSPVAICPYYISAVSVSGSGGNLQQCVLGALTKLEKCIRTS